MRRRGKSLLALALVTLALLAWASRDMILDGTDQYERKRCCQRMRVCALLVQSLAERHQPLPPSLQAWIAEDHEVADVFLGDVACYELVPPDPPGAAARDPASTLLLVEKKATHPGPRHALFADGHVDVAP